MNAVPATALAVDLGGTKLAAALVEDGRVLERCVRPTRRDAGPDAWLDQIVELAAGWAGRHDRVGVAVSGRVRAGRWSALNRRTLDLEPDYPLADRLGARLARPVHAVNDAQAAAWGEHRFGAGRGAGDSVFLTVSTGIGGGVIAGGRLLLGRGALAGHVGQVPVGTPPVPLEDVAGGRAIGAAAAAAGLGDDAAAAFAAARAGDARAERIVQGSADRVARLCATLAATLDPERIVLGGGVGLAEGYLERVVRALEAYPEPFRATVVRAALGADAGLVGVAALAREAIHPEGGPSA